MSQCVSLCVSEWHLTDSPAACVVDTIKEPSYMAGGVWLLLHPHTVQLSTSVYLVVWKVSQIMLTNIPDWATCGFFPPENKELCAFVVVTKIRDNLGGCQKHVKNICSHKERPIGINSVACGKGHGESVCPYEWRACLIWVSQTHLFPSRMDLMEATGQGADRFIRVISSRCPVSQSAVQQLPGLQWQPWWTPGGPIASDTGPSREARVPYWNTVQQ